MLRVSTSSTSQAQKENSLYQLQATENVDSKKQMLPVEHIRAHLFKIHLLKSVLRMPDRAASIFVILFYTQKTDRLRLATIFTSTTSGEGSKRKIESITSGEADHGPSTKDATPSKKPTYNHQVLRKNTEG